MIIHIHLLQSQLLLHDYKFASLCLLTAFIVTMLCIPQIIKIVNRYQLHDVPDARKEHKTPVPTFGGVAIFLGMMVAMFLWVPLRTEAHVVAFIFSIITLFCMGIFDDLRDLSATYKFIIEIAIASLIAVAGIRIQSFNGLFGIHELPVTAQYTLTVLAIVGITNAFNLIDGIDGLAGGLGFMSLITLGIFLTLSGEKSLGLVAFALAGGLLAFLYFNFNPARIFMGDTGSLILGFVISVLCIRLIQANIGTTHQVLENAPIFTLGIVLIPVFDTIRVFAIRIWKGKSPFAPDKTHIHHLLTNHGFGHSFATSAICVVHAAILWQVYWLRELPQELVLLLVVLVMLVVVVVFRNLALIRKYFPFKKSSKGLGWN